MLKKLELVRVLGLICLVAVLVAVSGCPGSDGNSAGEGEGEGATEGAGEGAGEGSGGSGSEGVGEGLGEGEGEIGSGDGKSGLTVLFSGDSGAVQDALAGLLKLASRDPKAGPVDVSDIESLTLTITAIELDRRGFDDAEGALVEVLESEFEPTAVTVEPGETVTWIWEVDLPHTVTSGALGEEDAGILFDGTGGAVGDTFEVTFNTAGLYPYFSDIPDDIDAGMAGTVEVLTDEGEDEGEGEGENEGENEGEGEGEGAKSGEEAAKITVFSGQLELNILDLTEISKVLSSVEVPSGEYTKIRLSVQDPRLVLRDEPDVVIEDVHLTANGRLFISKSFELPEGEENLLLLDFGGIHLVERGNANGFVLTPQLRVEIDLVSAAITLTGSVTSLNEEAGEMTVALEDDGEGREILVIVTDAVITDSDGAEQTVQALAAGPMVTVVGTLSVDGTVTASTVEILTEELP